MQKYVKRREDREWKKPNQKKRTQNIVHLWMGHKEYINWLQFGFSLTNWIIHTISVRKSGKVVMVSIFISSLFFFSAAENEQTTLRFAILWKLCGSVIICVYIDWQAHKKGRGTGRERERKFIKKGKQIPTHFYHTCLRRPATDWYNNTSRVLFMCG